MQAFLVLFCGHLWPLVEEVAATYRDPAAPGAQARAQALQQIRDRVATVLASTAVTMGEDSPYTHKAQLALLAAMTESLPRVDTALRPDARARLRVQLQRDRHLYAGSQYQAEFDQMLRELAEPK